jgi:hypothetical protein
MLWIKYNYYYINNVSKDYDDSQRNETVEQNAWAQESPKSELRLRSYEGLKLID